MSINDFLNIANNFLNHDDFRAIGINVVSNVITALLFIILGGGLYLIGLIRERRKLLKFFGVDDKHNNLKILVSRINVKEGGSIPVSGETITKGFVGAAIAKEEYDAALLIMKKIEPVWLTSIPNPIRQLLTRASILFIRFEPEIEIAPLNADGIPDTNIIALGSSIYNIATRCHTFERDDGYYFSRDSNGYLTVKRKSDGNKDINILGRESDRELAIIQRVRDEKSGRSVVICAGLGAEATFRCAQYLVNNILKLGATYKQDEFGHCISFEINNRVVL